MIQGFGEQYDKTKEEEEQQQQKKTKKQKNSVSSVFSATKQRPSNKKWHVNTKIKH